MHYNERTCFAVSMIQFSDAVFVYQKEQNDQRIGECLNNLFGLKATIKELRISA